MTDVDWTGETAIRLVEEYRQRPELWDSRHELYRVQTAKYEAWSDMARIFECDIADLRKKLNSVFASHRREKAKIRNGGRSTWFLYPYLSFLPNHLEKPSYHTEVIVFLFEAPSMQEKQPALISISNVLQEATPMIGAASSFEEPLTTIEQPNTLSSPFLLPCGTTNDAQISHSQNERSEQSSEDDDDDDDDREETEIMIKEEPAVQTYCISQPSVRQSKKKHVRAKEPPLKRYSRLTRPLLKRKIIKDHTQTDSTSVSNSLDSRLLETLRLLRKSDLSRKKDECDSFGEYIAVSLRKHDERTQSMIKQAINNILFEQEMKKYSMQGQYTVMVSGVDENPLVLGDTEDK